MCHAVEVNTDTGFITIDGDYWSVTIKNNKARESIGFITPADMKKCFKIYNSIINPKKDE